MPLPVSEPPISHHSDRHENSRVTKDSKNRDTPPVKGSSSEDRLPVVKRITAAMNRLSQENAAKKEEKKAPVKISVTKGRKTFKKLYHNNLLNRLKVFQLKRICCCQWKRAKEVLNL